VEFVIVAGTATDAKRSAEDTGLRFVIVAEHGSGGESQERPRPAEANPS
jgi:hypothetical protein